MGGIPVMAWVTIGVFLVGTLWSVGVWIAGRRINRMDKLEELVTGRDGLIRQVDRLVTREEFNDRHEEILMEIKANAEEGEAREQRIREHVDHGRRNVEQDLREVRRELSEIHKRVDAALRGARR